MCGPETEHRAPGSSAENSTELRAARPYDLLYMLSGFPILCIIRNNCILLVFVREDLLHFVCFLCRHFFGDKRSQLLAATGCSAGGLAELLGGDV